MIGKVPTIDVLSQMVQRSELKQKVISQNVANVNTPGFRTLELRFGELLTGGTPDSRQIAAQASIADATGLIAGEDGNNVNLERELGSLTRNSMEFNLYTQLLAARYAQLRSAITGQ